MTVHCLHIILLNGHGYMPFITSTTGMTPRGVRIVCLVFLRDTRLRMQTFQLFYSIKIYFIHCFCLCRSVGPYGDIPGPLGFGLKINGNL